MTEAAQDNGKTIAIISYITLIGWVVALIMHSSNKTKLGAFHIRQMLGIILVGLALSILGRVTGNLFLIWILQIAVIAFWVLGFVGAVQGEEREVPLLGKQFQDWFKGVA